METTYEKVDDTTLKVVKPIEATTEENVYDLDFLKQQEINILKQKNDFVESRNIELAEVREMIAKAESLGIKSAAIVDLEAETAKDVDVL